MIIKLLISLIFWLAPCVAFAVELVPNQTSEVTVTYDNGLAIAGSTKAKSRVGLISQGGAFNGSGPEVFSIFVENLSSEPFNLLPSGIRVTADSKINLGIMSSDEVDKVMRQAAGMAGLGNRLATLPPIGVPSAGMGNVQGSASTYGNFGNTPYSAQTRQQVQFYDPMAAAVQNAEQARRNEAHMAEARRREQEVLDSTLPMKFAAQTIAPGLSYITQFTIRSPKKRVQTVEIFVEVAGEIHQITYKVTR